MYRPDYVARATAQPEAELLLCCARAALGHEGDERVSALVQAGIDWPALMWRAQCHGMLPCLHRALGGDLARVCAAAVPPEATAELVRQREATIEQNNVLVKELVRLVAHLESRGIVAVPFKGPEMLEWLYGAMDVRRFGDLDILVDRSNLLAARRALLEDEYQEPASSADTPAWSSAALDSSYSRPFERRDPSVSVDLHWCISWPHLSVHIDPERLLGRAQAIRVGGATLRRLAPEDLLLVLSAHGAKHRWSLLKWVCDVAALLRAHPGMEWAAVWREGHRAGSQRMLALALRLAHDLLGASLPPPIQRRVEADRVVAALAAGVTVHLFSGPDFPPSGRQAFSFHLRVRERIADRVRFAMYLARHTDIPERWQLPLPALCSMLYYLARPPWRATRYARHWLARRAPRALQGGG
jgi:hypothetical protein